MTGLILASFGTLDDGERARTIDAVVNEMRAALPSVKILSALTSNFIRRKLIDRGLNVRSIEECLLILRADRLDEITILPTHLTPGEEFEQKIMPFATEGVKVLTPLFTKDCSTAFDRRALSIIIDCHRPSSDETLVLIGHGSPHRHNPVYECLQRLEERILIGVIEPTDRPNFDDVLKRLSTIGSKKLLLAPLLLTGGAHVVNDIFGSDEGSWLSRLRALGFDVHIHTDGLGAFAAFRRLYLEKYLSSL